MGLRDTFTRHLPHRVAANASPLGGSDGNGYAIADFSPSLVSSIRLGAYVASIDSLYRRQPSVRTCVSFLATNIAPLKIKVFRENPDGAPMRLHGHDHPLPRLLEHPNPNQTRFDLIRDTVSDLALYGNAFWLKQFNGSARALIRIPPRFIRPDGGDVLSGARRFLLHSPSTGLDTSLAKDKVIHFRGYNPLDPRIGVSPLEALRHVLNEDSEASRHRQWFWKNHAGRDGIIERPADAPEWDEPARERFREDWANKHTGAESGGDTPVLEDGMRWRSDGFSPRDSEFIEGREFTLDTVATAYHIPLMALSRKSTATFASAKEFHKMLYVDTLGPWNAMMEGAIQLFLVPDFPDSEGIYVEFNIDEKLQGDFEEQTNAARQSVQVPWMSVDDMRIKRGLEPLGDEYAVPARPANFVYGDDDAEEPTEETENEGEDSTASLELAAMNGHHAIDPQLVGTLEDKS
jgi:HK97 family phage portal protein